MCFRARVTKQVAAAATTHSTGVEWVVSMGEGA